MKTRIWRAAIAGVACCVLVGCIDQGRKDLEPSTRTFVDSIVLPTGFEDDGPSRYGPEGTERPTLRSRVYVADDSIDSSELVRYLRTRFGGSLSKDLALCRRTVGGLELPNAIFEATWRDDTTLLGRTVSLIVNRDESSARRRYVAIVGEYWSSMSGPAAATASWPRCVGSPGAA